MSHKNDDSIELSPKHGVNPTISVCAYCGEDKNELALVGRIRIEDDDDAEMSMRSILNLEPCDNCKKKIDDEGFRGFLGNCGHNGLVKFSALPEHLQTLIGDVKVFRMEKCFQCLGMIEK